MPRAISSVGPLIWFLHSFEFMCDTAASPPRRLEHIVRKLRHVNLAQKRGYLAVPSLLRKIEQGPYDIAESNPVTISACKPDSSPTSFAAGYGQNLTICPCF